MSERHQTASEENLSNRKTMERSQEPGGKQEGGGRNFERKVTDSTRVRQTDRVGAEERREGGRLTATDMFTSSTMAGKRGIYI